MKVNIQELRQKAAVVASQPAKPKPTQAPFGVGLNKDQPAYLLSSEDLFKCFVMWGVHNKTLPPWHKPRIIELESSYTSERFNANYNRVILERIGSSDDLTMIAWRCLLRNREIPQSI